MMPGYVECDECPRSMGCYEKCMKAQAREIQSAWPTVPPQVWPQPRQPSPEEAEQYREAYFRDFVREMAECGLTEMHEAAPSGQIAFTGTREQWLSFFHKLEADAAQGDDF